MVRNRQITPPANGFEFEHRRQRVARPAAGPGDSRAEVVGAGLPLLGLCLEQSDLGRLGRRDGRAMARRRPARPGERPFSAQGERHGRLTLQRARFRRGRLEEAGGVAGDRAGPDRPRLVDAAADTCGWPAQGRSGDLKCRIRLSGRRVLDGRSRLRLAGRCPGRERTVLRRHAAGCWENRACSRSRWPRCCRCSCRPRRRCLPAGRSTGWPVSAVADVRRRRAAPWPMPGRPLSGRPLGKTALDTIPRFWWNPLRRDGSLFFKAYLPRFDFPATRYLTALRQRSCWPCRAANRPARRSHLRRRVGRRRPQGQKSESVPGGTRSASPAKPKPQTTSDSSLCHVLSSDKETPCTVARSLSRRPVAAAGPALCRWRASGGPAARRRNRRRGCGTCFRARKTPSCGRRSRPKFPHGRESGLQVGHSCAGAGGRRISSNRYNLPSNPATFPKIGMRRLCALSRARALN